MAICMAVMERDYPKLDDESKAIVTRQIRVTGSCSSCGEYPACIDLLASGAIQVEPLITARVPDARILIAGQGEDFSRYARMMVHPDRFMVHNEFISEDRAAEVWRAAVGANDRRAVRAAAVG